jgi:Neuraminidase (sialidase)
LPTGNAEVRVLSLDKKGKGFVTIRVDEDTTSGSKKIGYLTFVTKDGGKTWTVPEVNPNMLTETIQDSTTGFEGIMKIIERNF